MSLFIQNHMSSERSYKVGVLGLGIIGSIWARNWNEDGLLSASWNRTPAPDFPQWQPSPAAVARRADVLVVVVADPAAAESVINQMLPELDAHHIVVQSSTIDPDSSERFRTLVEGRGARYLEAPFTGSKPAAEQRQTVFYLGGDTALVNELDATLAVVSSKRIHIGTGRQAATLKLAMNLQIALQAEALCESILLCRDAGVDDDVFFTALSRNAACSPLVKLKEPKLRVEDYTPQFSIKHMHKDMRLALQASKQGHTLPLLAAIEERLRQTAEAGLADEDFIALYKTL